MKVSARLRKSDPWNDFQRQATEGVATWLSRLPGGVEAFVPAGAVSSAEARLDADRLRAFVRERITSNPVTWGPLSPVQIHLLELALGAVHWPALVAAGEHLAADEPEDASAEPRRGESS